MNKSFFIALGSAIIASSCGNNSSTQKQTMADSASIHLVTLDPGHFHAALVQKSMYPEVDSVVHVYAPAGDDIKMHLDKINGYNTRKEQPTRW